MQIMSACALLQDLHAKDIRLTIQGESLTYDAPEGALTAELLEALRQHKAALLTLLAQAPKEPPPPPRGTSGSRGTALPQVGDWVNVLSEDGRITNEAAAADPDHSAQFGRDALCPVCRGWLGLAARTLRACSPGSSAA